MDLSQEAGVGPAPVERVTGAERAAGAAGLVLLTLASAQFLMTADGWQAASPGLARLRAGGSLGGKTGPARACACSRLLTPARLNFRISRAVICTTGTSVPSPAESFHGGRCSVLRSVGTGSCIWSRAI